MKTYWGDNFFQFFQTMAIRFIDVITGRIPLAADEIQILVLSCIAISFGLIGPFLVLKRMTMLANSLSHTILLGLVLSFLVCRALFHQSELFHLPGLLFGALAAAFLTVLFTSIVSRYLRLQEDASIGLVFTALFALGILAVTLFTRDVHLGVEAVMGNADALQTADLKLAAAMVVLNGALILCLFWPLQCSAFDGPFSRSQGLPCAFFHHLLFFLTAANCIAAFRAVGVLLVLSFLVGPYLAARICNDRLSRLLVLTPLFGILASVFGVALARHILTVSGVALSTAGLVSVCIGFMFVLVALVTRVRKFVFARSAESVNL